MEFIKPNINIDFVGKRKIAYAVSLTMILISILSLIFHGGPKYGIDFVGGTVIQIKFSAAVVINDIKAGLSEMGLENSTIQTFGNEADHDYLIRTESPLETDDSFSQKIKAAIQKTTGAEPDIRRVEMVGPQNDTIIVFDRIRENLKNHPKNPFMETINKSVNETLSRTILTSSTSLVAVLALFILGGGIIHDFAFAMLVGIVVGTYSSVYVASPILLAWQAAAKKK